MSIILDRERGLNPRLTFCTRCGGDGAELVLAGNRNWKATCGSCGKVGYGFSISEKCECGAADWQNRTKLTDYEKLPSPSLCDKCSQEIAEHRQIVAEGGVLLRCKLGHEGVIKDSEYARDVRQASGVEAPNPVGVEFESEDCPACHPEILEGGEG